MRLLLAASFLAATALTPVFAAEIATPSRVDAVTVYPQGAEVTRIAEATLEAGEHTLILKDLPGELDPQSLRVEGDAEGAIEIASVDTRSVYVASDAQDAERKRIEGEIEALQNERSMLDVAVGDANQRKQLILALIDKQVRPPGANDNAVRIDAAQLSALFDLAGEKQTALNKAIGEAQTRQRAIDKAVQDLSNKLNEIAPEQVAKTEVSIFLAVPAATKGAFKIRYRVQNAGWSPFYDARLASPAKDQPAKVELVRRAEATQSTGEVWENVELTLSTARPLGATAAPELWPEEIQVLPDEPPKPVMSEESAGGANDFAAAAPEADAEKPQATRMLSKKRVEQRQANVEVSGFQALYGIPGRVTIDNSGTSKKVRISTASYDANLVAVAVPMADPTAYLTAAFKIAGETPLLPGPVNLYRDGVFMGQGGLGLLNPGEEAKLGFGADDLIKVKRAEVKRETGEEGLITSSNIDERAFDIEVKNLHDIKIAVTVLDRLPFSTNEQVVVEPMSGMTQATLKDFEKRRGVLAWTFDLEPAEEKTVKLGYKVSWPKEMKIGFGGN